MSVHLLREVDALKKRMLSLGAMVEDAVHKSVAAVVAGDIAMARRVIENDTEIDRVEVDIEEECLKVLALYQPVAIDLRFIVAMLKINSDLERIGDLAVNIGEQLLFLGNRAAPKLSFDFEEMAARAKRMLKNSLDALVNLDGILAREVIRDDDEVDGMFRDILRQVKDNLHIQPEQTDVLFTVLMISRQLERIADHATNIAEDVIYMIDGHIVRHKTSTC